MQPVAVGHRSAASLVPVVARLYVLKLSVAHLEQGRSWARTSTRHHLEEGAEETKACWIFEEIEGAWLV